MRAIYKKQGGQCVVVATCADDQIHDDQHVYTTNFTFGALPACDGATRAYIDSHSNVTLSLWAVDESTDQIRLRTPSEMDALPHCSWPTYSLKARE